MMKGLSVVMTLFEALILGIVQGITEFLPISSTAHIVIVQLLMDIQFQGYVLEIFLHLASVLAVIIYFRQDLLQIISGSVAYFKSKSEENRIKFRYALYLILATLITGLLGIFLKDLVDDSLKSPIIISISLVVTGLFLILIERYRQIGNRDESSMTIVDTVIIALVQTLAVLPGISRSGSTLIAGLWVGLSREAAVRFSFLLAIPIILGSTVLMINELNMDTIQQTGFLPIVVAFVSTFIFSIIGIIWLIDLLKKSKLIYFAIYCFLLALFVFIYLQADPLIEL